MQALNLSDGMAWKWHSGAYTYQLELLDLSGRVVKQLMDLVFLAAGIENGFWFIADEGNWVEGRR